MEEKTKYIVIGLFIFLIGTLLGYVSGSSATGMYLQTTPTEPIKCVDTDPENDPYAYGEVILNDVVYQDKCASDVLYESYCGEYGNVRRLRQKCDNGCLDGVCIK